MTKQLPKWMSHMYHFQNVPSLSRLSCLAQNISQREMLTQLCHVDGNTRCGHTNNWTSRIGKQLASNPSSSWDIARVANRIQFKQNPAQMLSAEKIHIYGSMWIASNSGNCCSWTIKHCLPKTQCVMSKIICMST